MLAVQSDSLGWMKVCASNAESQKGTAPQISQQVVKAPPGMSSLKIARARMRKEMWKEVG